MSFRQTQLDLFETAATKQYRLGLPKDLATLVSRLPLGSNLTINRLLEEHTLFLYYRTFLTSREVKRLQELMLGRENKSIAEVARIPKLRLYNPQYLKFCPQCLEEDLRLYGETYWHRLHQVPGIEVCLTHRKRLRNSSVLVEEMGKGFVAADEENCFRDEVGDVEAVKLSLWQFGKMLEEMMQQGRSFQGLENLREDYKRILIDKGFLKGVATGGYRLDEERLAEEVLEIYGEEVLQVIHPEMMEDLGTYLASCLLGCDLLQEVDRVVHWLVWKVLKI